MKPLSGLRMLDLTHMVSGPYCGMILADLGAEAIKIEPPDTGEISRRIMHTDPRSSIHGQSAYVLTLSRNKKSVTLNLKSAEGLAVFYELVKHSDIVLNNFSAGVPARLGIDYDQLSAINPRIITCSITGFGETGPAKDWTSFDMVAQAMGGGMSITGEGPQSVPLRSGVPMADLTGGMMAAIGILSAAQARTHSGRGQHVDISMLDTQLSMLNYLATIYFISGYAPQRDGNSHFAHVPYNTFPCSDGYLILACVSDEFFTGAMKALQLDELLTPEHAQAAGRQQNRVAIDRAVAARTRTHTKAHWLARLREQRVPCAPVNDLDEALSQPQALARNMIVNVPTPEGGHIKQTGNPVKMSQMREENYAPAPLLGQHTEEVLMQLLGKTDDEIAALRARGVL